MPADAFATVALTPWQLIRRYGLRKNLLTQVDPAEVVDVLDRLMPPWRSELARVVGRAVSDELVPPRLLSQPEQVMDTFAERVVAGVELTLLGTLRDDRTVRLRIRIDFDGSVDLSPRAEIG